MSVCRKHNPIDEGPCRECESEATWDAAYAQGRADERAAVVSWLRGHDSMWSGTAVRIERGEHLPEVKP